MFPLHRSAYLTVLKMSKMMMTVLGHARIQVVIEACNSDTPVAPKEHEEAVALQQVLLHIPDHGSEFNMRNVASRLGGQLGEQVHKFLDLFS